MRYIVPINCDYNWVVLRNNHLGIYLLSVRKLVNVGSCTRLVGAE